LKEKFAEVLSLASYGALSLVSGGTASLRGNPAIAGVQKFHRTGDFCEPDQRQRPPNLARDCKDGIGAAVLLSIGEQESQFPQQQFPVHPKQRANAGILQRSDGHATAPENGGDPSGQPGAESALGIEKEPAFGVPAFAIRIFMR